MKSKAMEVGNEVLSLTLNSRELLRSLLLVGKVIGPNPIVPVLENTKVEISAGKLEFTGNNLKQAITSSIDYGIIGETGTFLLPHKKTVDLLKTLPDVPVTITHSRSGKTCAVQIEVDGKKFNLQSDPHEDFRKPTLFSGESVQLPVKQLKEALNICLATVSDDDMHPTRLGIHFNTHDGEIVSCDGGNITVYRTGLELSGKPFTIPSSFVKLILDCVSDDQENATLEVSDNSVRISNDTTSITSILIAERFVPYQNALPTSAEISGDINTREWSTALKRALIFANATTNATRNTFSGGWLTIVTEDKDFGSESSQGIDFGSNCEFVIGLQGKVISNILQKLPADTARLDMTTPNRGVCIYPHGTLAKELLIMSMPVMLATDL